MKTHNDNIDMFVHDQPFNDVIGDFIITLITSHIYIYRVHLS